MSRDLSGDFRVVSIYNIKTRMLSDEVVISGVDSIVSVNDAFVHIRLVTE